jgi:NAD(P)-dependent dehydrogenase (short-subunit alcohol dehydrogenase family)
MKTMNQVTLVTGGTGVVGSAVVRRILGQGRSVCLTYRHNQSEVESIQKDLRPGNRLFAVQADFSNPQGVSRLIDDLTQLNVSVTELVHAAAIVDHTPFDQLTAEKFSEVFAVNITSAFSLVRALDMAASLRAVVLLSSIAADFTGIGSMAYEVSKGAINSLTRALAAHLAPRVRINSLAPGIIQSHRTDDDAFLSGRVIADRTPDGQLIEPDQVAQMILLLLEDRSRFVTGQVLRMDGGLSLRLF